MKILFVTNNYTPYSGGVVSSIEAFRHELKLQGHPVIVVTLDFLGDGVVEDNVIRLTCPIRFTYHGNPIAIPFFARSEIQKIIEEHKPAIVHTHHPFILGPVAVRLAKKYTIPSIFTYHSQYASYADHYMPFFKELAHSFIAKWVESFCNKVDRIITPTLSVKNQLQKNKVSTPITVIPTGILPVFESQNCPKKQQEKNSFNLLTVSRFAPEKNITFLLDLMTQLDDCYTLTLVGFGAQLSFLKEYAFKKCKLSSRRITFVVKPTKTVVAQHYKEADLFIFASTTETQALVLLESMAAGTPVVALKAPGVQDIVQDGSNGLLVSTLKEMKEKIELLKNNKELYKNLHKNACESAKEYNIAITTKKLINVYQSML